MIQCDGFDSLTALLWRKEGRHINPFVSLRIVRSWLLNLQVFGLFHSVALTLRVAQQLLKFILKTKNGICSSLRMGLGTENRGWTMESWNLFTEPKRLGVKLCHSFMVVPWRYQERTGTFTECMLIRAVERCFTTFTMCCEIAKISHGNEVANCAEKSVGKTNNNVLFV